MLYFSADLLLLSTGKVWNERRQWFSKGLLILHYLNVSYCEFCAMITLKILYHTHFTVFFHRIQFIPLIEHSCISWNIHSKTASYCNPMWIDIHVVYSQSNIQHFKQNCYKVNKFLIFCTLQTIQDVSQFSVNTSQKVKTAFGTLFQWV